jgi:hypothetical protein
VHNGLQWGNLRARDYLERLEADGKITLKWIFRKWEVGGKSWTDLA